LKEIENQVIKKHNRHFKIFRNLVFG